MHGLLGCNFNAGVHTRGRSGPVTQRCHNGPDGKRGYRVRVMSHTGSARRIWGILKKSVEFCLGRRRLGFACSPKPGQWPCGGCHTCVCVGGADGKVIIERLCISLPYVETFNSKVIKGFVPELRSRYVFFVFRDSYVLFVYVMNILCTFHVFMYGYVTH